MNAPLSPDKLRKSLS
jgi:hypothetical protein